MGQSRVIAFANQKGGVGKTTSLFTIANVLADQGQRVLMIDLDPQASLTICCGLMDNLIDEKKPIAGMQDVLCEARPIEEIVLPVCEKANLFIAPATVDLAKAELLLAGEIAREQCLKKALSPVRGRYNFILIDCQPSLGLLVINALAASDGVVIPVTPDYLAYKGLGLIVGSITKIKASMNENIRVLGVIITMVERNTVHARDVIELLRGQFPILGEVGRSTLVKQAAFEWRSITTISPSHAISAQYRAIAEAIRNG